MKTLLVLASAGALLFSQETRREVTNPASNPADDRKGLSPSVPDVTLGVLGDDTDLRNVDNKSYR